MAEIKRQVAIPVKISSLKRGEYVKQEGWDPNYILTLSKKKVSRANIIAIVVNVPADDRLEVDDGSGTINLRQFDQNLRFTHLKTGDPVLIIGRPREYEREIYLIPEIVKKLKNPMWLKVRAQQLQGEVEPADNFGSNEQESNSNNQVQVSDQGEVSTPTESKSFRSHYENLYSLIKSLDDGSGADIEEVLQSANIPDGENIIKQLILEGEVFELSPGKLKILN